MTKPTPPKISSNPIPLAGFEQIPYESIVAICKIIKEGEAVHGRDNWKGAAGHPSVINERLAHVINHAMLYISGDRNEDHLAKVAWGGIFMREVARMTGDHQDCEY